jgi:hypothetical protein
MTRIGFAIATGLALMSLGVSPSQAQYSGDAPWCAVVSIGTGGIHYDCYYYTVEACVPNVLAGNRGFCAMNPYYSSSRAAMGPAVYGAPAPRYRHYPHKHAHKHAYVH